MHKEDYIVDNQRDLPLWEISNNGYFVDTEWLYEQKKDTKNKLQLIYIQRSDQGSTKFIPESVVLNSIDFSPNDGLFYSPEKCLQVFRQYGISNNKMLVFYSQRTRVACRIAFVAYWLGFDNIKILNGGIDSWIKKGYPTVEEPLERFNEVSEINNAPQRTKALISTADDVLQFMKTQNNTVLASVRNWDEFIGETMGHSWNAAIGEIKGAVYAGYHNIIDKTECVVAPEYFLKKWEKWGINSSKHTIFYCGTGWRASLAFFVAKELGWKNIHLYDGSWYDWFQAHQKEPNKYPIQIGLDQKYAKMLGEKESEN